AKTDVNAMFIRGYSSAAQAMVLLDKNSRRPKGHGISFLPPDQGISPITRLGIFVCRCNDSLGWLSEMDDHIKGLYTLKDVIHAEVVNAACTSQGSSYILRTIRNKGVTRVVLASCVCCPLNFVCNACTDQKSRLKEALFTATGISRSVVETCNLRGEVLRLVKSDPEMAQITFEGMINRSVVRARKLKALPALARNYNLATAVIGGSEAAASSALILADAGLEVFWFSTPGKPLAEPPGHSNIHNFKEAGITCLSGTIGEFQISFQIDEFEQTLHVGAVILGEKARKVVPYVYQEGLPGITIKSGRQKLGKTGIPFFYPGATSIPGLFLADPPGIHVSQRKKGAAAAIQAAAIMPRGPRQSKGFTVVVDDKLCRSCGRCMDACPYQAITLSRNAMDIWYASVDEALCKGCGNCISVCPTNAADSPYRNQAILEETIKELLVN
ncbi:MAG: 4Fe-4S dicluster domain-containing protein, partial [Desulfobacterales bacterium]|nr:4Fe-4S dicluster domain-containing protein [Desulfobacterales bacterium]